MKSDQEQNVVAVAAVVTASLIAISGCTSMMMVLMKLAGVITLAWWTVLAPAFVGCGLAVLGLGAAVAGILVLGVHDIRVQRRRLAEHDAKAERTMRPNQHGPAQKWPRR